MSAHRTAPQRTAQPLFSLLVLSLSSHMAAQRYVARAAELSGRVAEACKGTEVFNLVYRRAIVSLMKQLEVDRKAGCNVITSAWVKVGL